jgi:hypothetical protein
MMWDKCEINDLRWQENTPKNSMNKLHSPKAFDERDEDHQLRMSVGV